MNAGFPGNDPAMHYYDSDYPSRDGIYPENFDEITTYQGIADDVARYKQIAERTGGPILELCCGTGRVALPLARAGFEVTAVDVAPGMLQRFKAKLAAESEPVRSRVKILMQDVTKLDVGSRKHGVVIIAFNSLLCISDFHDQCQTVAAAGHCLTDNGVLVVDVINPLLLNVNGDPVPSPFFTRRSIDRGNLYTRFAMRAPIDEHQRQRLHGWYDEIDVNGFVKRRFYSILWRPIFRYEFELMLQLAMLQIIKIEGGHNGEVFSAQSPRMFVQAMRLRKSS